MGHTVLPAEDDQESRDALTALVEKTSSLELGVDSAQGFYLAPPAPAPLDEMLAAAATNGETG